MLIYVAGIPIITLAILYKYRRLIRSKKESQEKERLAKSLGSLYMQYKSTYYWWECLEMLKKMMLTGGLILLGPGSSAQVFLAVLIILGYLCLVLKCNPYQENDDDFLQFLATTTILLTLVAGMALRADDAVTSGYYESGVMSTLLVAVNSFIFLALAYTVHNSTKSLRIVLWNLLCCKKTKKPSKVAPQSSEAVSGVVPSSAAKKADMIWKE